MTPQQNTIISLLETNDITIGYLNNKLIEFGYYNPIKKRDYEWDKLYQLRKRVEKDNIYNSVLREYFPRIMFGRQKGHTTAIAEFIGNNTDLKIGVMFPVKTHYETLIRKLKDSGTNTNNVFWVRKDDSLNGLRGLKLDYIIIDTYGSIGLSQKDFESMLFISKDDIRIAGVGN